ncbi:hypothetical protein [Streptomyces sp. MST-110588]|nr:hypothetical protein [Streptomyces sp. MST-110588]
MTEKPPPEEKDERTAQVEKRRAELVAKVREANRRSARRHHGPL